MASSLFETSLSKVGRNVLDDDDARNAALPTNESAFYEEHVNGNVTKGSGCR